MAMICMVLQLIAVMNNAIARITTIFFDSYLIIIPNVFEKSDRLKSNWQITYPAVIGFFLIYYFGYSYMKGFFITTAFCLSQIWGKRNGCFLLFDGKYKNNNDESVDNTGDLKGYKDYGLQ